jgi:hypothetical protein
MLLFRLVTLIDFYIFFKLEADIVFRSSRMKSDLGSYAQQVCGHICLLRCFFRRVRQHMVFIHLFAVSNHDGQYA